MDESNPASTSTRPIEAEVAVIGGGLAGLVAASRLAQLGRKPLVLEKGADERYLCNSRMTGGAIHVCFRDPMRPAHELRDAIDAATAGTAGGELADAVATDAGRVVRWLQGEGVAFARGGAEEYKRWVMTPLRPARAGPQWCGRGGDISLRTLETNLLRRGGRLMRNARVMSAQPLADRRWALATETGAIVHARAVVIADGGFQNNPELVAQYISPQPARLLQRGAATGCGDGLRLAQSLGAAAVGRAILWTRPSGRSSDQR